MARTSNLLQHQHCHCCVRRSACSGIYSLFLTLVTLHSASSHTEAFIQSDNVIEVLRFDEGGLLEAETTIGLSSYQQKSVSLHRGNCRPIRFEPPMLDFHEHKISLAVLPVPHSLLSKELSAAVRLLSSFSSSLKLDFT